MDNGLEGTVGCCWVSPCRGPGCYCGELQAGSFCVGFRSWCWPTNQIGDQWGAQPAAWQWEAWRPCVPHPHSSQIQLVFGESSDRGQSKGKKKLWTSFGQRTKDWHPQSEVTSFGPHNPWVGEPFWMLDHLIPRAPCFLSRAGARKK